MSNEPKRVLHVLGTTNLGGAESRVMELYRSIDREKMLADRDVITVKISKYMSANGYTLSPKSKNYHALDSLVYE